MYKGNHFKSPIGSYLLQALFYEQAIGTDRSDCLYTLKLEDTPDHLRPDVVYISLHKAYVDLADTTEYDFAKKYFDGWAHWKRLTECTWFKPYLSDMREELEVKLKAQALNRIRAVALDPANKSHYMANKFITDSGLVIKKDNRGRPSKEKIKQEAEKLFQTSEEVNEDFERIKVN